MDGNEVVEQVVEETEFNTPEIEWLRKIAAGVDSLGLGALLDAVEEFYRGKSLDAQARASARAAAWNRKSPDERDLYMATRRSTPGDWNTPRGVGLALSDRDRAQGGIRAVRFIRHLLNG